MQAEGGGPLSRSPRRRHSTGFLSHLLGSWASEVSVSISSLRWLSPLQLQSYFAACEDETPAIRNHDKVLQRLCEHLDHALLYG